MTEQVENDVKENVETQTTEQESSTAELNNAEGIALIDDDSVAEETNEADTNGEPEDETDGKTETETSTEDNAEPKRKNAETRKQQLNNEIRDKIAERNALRDEIAKLNQQKYQLKNTDDLPTVEALMEQQNPDTGDYYTRMEAEIARIKAERQLEQEQRQLNEYTERIVDNRMRLKDEATRALKDFPIFDEESDSYNKDLAETANRIAESLILKDQNTGEIIGAHGSIYDVYAAIAGAANSAETSGKIAGRKAAVEMMNSADVVGTSGTGNSSDDENDPFLEGFQSVDY